MQHTVHCIVCMYTEKYTQCLEDVLYLVHTGMQRAILLLHSLGTSMLLTLYMYTTEV